MKETKGFIHTFAGKIVVAAAVCVVAGGAVAVAINSQKNHEEAAESMVASDGNEAGEENVAAGNVSQEPAEAEEKPVTDEQYPELLEGGMTREQFEFALAYGPQSMTDGQISVDVLQELLFRVAMTGDYYDLGINSTGENVDAWKPYSLEELNSYISVLTDYQFSEADNDSYSYVKVSGDTLSIIMAEPSSSNYVTIQNATVKGDVMKVEYQFEHVYYSEDLGDEVHDTCQRVAILRKTDSGRYRVTDLVDERMMAGRKEAYILTLENLYTDRIWPDGTEKDSDGSDMSDNVFAVCDVDGDGEEELIIRYDTCPMYAMEEAVYGYDSETGALRQEISEFPWLVYYDNGFVRADSSHNQSDDADAWPYTMYQYAEGADLYGEVGTGVSGDGSIESYVGEGKEMEIPFVNLTEENIQGIQ